MTSCGRLDAPEDLEVAAAHLPQSLLAVHCFAAGVLITVLINHRQKKVHVGVAAAEVVLGGGVGAGGGAEQALRLAGVQVLAVAVEEGLHRVDVHGNDLLRSTFQTGRLVVLQFGHQLVLLAEEEEEEKEEDKDNLY